MKPVVATRRTFRDYFGKEKKALKVFGLSLSGDEGWPYKIYSFLLLFCGNFLYPALGFVELFKHEFDVVADMLAYECGITIAAFKTFVVLRNRRKFGEILSKLEKEPFIVDLERGGEEEERLLQTCLKITTVQTLTYWVFTSITVAGTMLFSIIKRLTSNDSKNWQLSYGPLTVLNTTYSPNYEISWCYQSVSIISLALHFTTIDLLMTAILVHISYQFKILQNNIRRIVENSYKEMNKHMATGSAVNVIHSYIDRSTIPWKYLHSSLKKAVSYHIAILDLATEMEHVFSELLLLIFLGTLAMLCFFIFNASLPEHRGRVWRYLGEIVITCLQILMVCFWGEIVVFESQQVGIAAYEANFVGTDSRFQKGLAMIIRRSQNPTKLTAGKFADICLATFTWIQRTSYSSFMVLSHANAKKM